MLKFTNPLVNRVDKNVSDLMDNHLGNLLPSNIDKQSLTLNDKPVINFSTNSCLGIENDIRIREAIAEKVMTSGASFIVSRIFISPPEFSEFSDRLHRIFESYPVITASTTLSHLSALPVLIQKNDVLIFDMFAHNSLRLASHTINNTIATKTLPHNNMNELDKIVRKLQENKNVNNIWYLGDGIYSMLGSHCNIKRLAELLEKYPNFYAYIDDAHGMSIMGKHGRGFALSHFETQPDKLVVAISLSKSFGIGCGGAVVVPNPEWQRKIRRCGPTRISSSPIPLPMLAGAIASTNLHLSDDIIQLQEALALRAKWLIEYAHEYQLTLVDEAYSSIFYCKIGQWDKTLAVAQYMLNHGFYVNACTFPAVPDAYSGIRMVITIYHSQEEIRQLVKTLQAAM